MKVYAKTFIQRIVGVPLTASRIATSSPGPIFYVLPHVLFTVVSITLLKKFIRFN